MIQLKYFIRDIPKVPYVKSIDIWMIGCESLVFMSLLEFTLAQFLQRRKEPEKGPTKKLRSKIKVRPKAEDESKDRNRTRRISRVIGLQSEEDDIRQGKPGNEKHCCSVIID